MQTAMNVHVAKNTIKITCMSFLNVNYTNNCDTWCYSEVIAGEYVTSNKAGCNCYKLDDFFVEVSEVDDDDEDEGEQIWEEAQDEKGLGRLFLFLIVGSKITISPTLKQNFLR